jgi:cyclophilin family peptidyl-prolyl cis-trans isomerase
MRAASFLFLLALGEPRSLPKTRLVMPILRRRGHTNPDHHVAKIWSCETSNLGRFKVRLRDDWSHYGAERLEKLTEAGFWNEVPFFRVNQWITQFGAVQQDSSKPWSSLYHTQIPDDPSPFEGKGWPRGIVAMAGGGPGTRTSQFLVVIKPNEWNGGPAKGGGAMGAEKHDAPVGEVIEGMDTVFDLLYQGYGDLPQARCAHGKCKDDPENTPDQTKIFNEGNAYVKTNFPNVTFIRSCTIVME